MQQALKHLEDTSDPIRETARLFNVPESSLRHKYSGRVDANAVKSGPAPMFTPEEENKIYSYFKMMSSFGYGFSRYFDSL